MTKRLHSFFRFLLLLTILLPSRFAASAECDGSIPGVNDRIGWSADGNMHDPDDWESPIAGGYQSGRYGYFLEGIDKADLIGAIKKKGSSVGAAFKNDAGSKAEIKHSMHHIGF